MATRKTGFEKSISYIAINLKKMGWDTFQILTLILSILYFAFAYFYYHLAGLTVFWLVTSAFLVTDALCIVYSVMKKKKNKAANTLKELQTLKSGIRTVDRMNPYAFEEYIGQLYRDNGYTIKVTKKSGDNGGDVIAEKGSRKICIQVKHYAVKVPYRAVQEVVSAMVLYHCNECAIVTNSVFTKQARMNATKMNIDLIDRDGLIQMINETKDALENTERASARKRL